MKFTLYANIRIAQTDCGAYGAQNALTVTREKVIEINTLDDAAKILAAIDKVIEIK